MGDGIGHIALTGVALGFLLGPRPCSPRSWSPSLGAVAIELIRERGRTSGDVALALLFYGGIAGGVLLIGLSPGGQQRDAGGLPVRLAVERRDRRSRRHRGLSVAVLGVVAVFGRELFAVCQDEEVARVSGLPVRFLNLLVAVTAAVTVTVAMRVVGLLLVSALMVVPVATAQQLTRSFRTTLLGACLLGRWPASVGLVLAFYADVAPGAPPWSWPWARFLVAALAGRPRRSGRRSGEATGSALRSREALARSEGFPARRRCTRRCATAARASG